MNNSEKRKRKRKKLSTPRRLNDDERRLGLIGPSVGIGDVIQIVVVIANLVSIIIL